MKDKEREGNRAGGVIPLKDLIPRKDPKAGKEGRGEPAVFGAVRTPLRGGATTTEEEKGRKKDSG